MPGILVVDDEPICRELLQRALEVEGYKVMGAADGKEESGCRRAGDEEEDHRVIQSLQALAPGARRNCLADLGHASAHRRRRLWYTPVSRTRAA